jgi:hypothetical protein
MAVAAIVWALGSVCAAAQASPDEAESTPQEGPQMIAPASVVPIAVERGNILIGEEENAPGELAAGLAARGISPRKRIRLHADGRVTYGGSCRSWLMCPRPTSETSS